MEELVIPATSTTEVPTTTTKDNLANDNDDDYWKQEPKQQEEQKSSPIPKHQDPGEPMIIIDITKLDPKIHSKFDRNSVNDADGASAWKRKVEDHYEDYSKNADLLSQGSVIPCGSSVWRSALIKLRDERPGHYFAPIFPPKKK